MKHVALIRGIGPENPNMHGNKLKEFFEKLGFKNVKPIISSGNVIFESDQVNKNSLESLIEENLPKMLGFSRITIVRNYNELQKIFNSDPFKGVEDTSTSRLHVTFLKTGGEVFSVIDTVTIGTTKIMSVLEKKYGKNITTRTWKTIGRIIKNMENE